MKCKKDLAIYIPTYKEWDDLDKNEQASFNQTYKVCSSRDIVLSYKKGMNLAGYKHVKKGVELDPELCTYKGYNALLESKAFYNIFTEYRYVAIVQLDVWLFEDRFDYFIRKFDKHGYDYIGAPWYGVDFAKDGEVGNGGFSLRRVDKFIDICSRWKMKGNEDHVFCKPIKESGQLSVAPEKLALEFSFEEQPAHAYELNKYRLPMGTHAYMKTSERLRFWVHHIPEMYVNISNCKS